MRPLAFTLALAAAGLAAAPALAAAARIAWSDLDLATEAGKAELDRRIAAGARELCAQQVATGTITRGESRPRAAWPMRAPRSPRKSRPRPATVASPPIATPPRPRRTEF